MSHHNKHRYRTEDELEILHGIRELRCRAVLMQQQLDRIEAVLAILQAQNPPAPNPNPSFQGGAIMFIVQDDNPDVGYHITPPTATDAEGNPVDAGSLTFEALSTDENVLTITPNPADQLSGTVHFGAPGQASVNINVKTAAGTLLGAIGAQFTVTAGDPSAISGGSVSFDGLTEAPPA